MSPRRRPLATTLMLLLALLALTATASAAPQPRTSFTDVEAEVMCVSCGVPLNIAESPQADRERAEIHRLIAQGLTKQQVKDALIVTYGRRVIATPDSSGFGLAAYLVPLALAIAVLTLLAVLLPRWRRARTDALHATATTNGHGTGALSPQDARRLEEDLARYDV
jgi:cytochrome c-type biogenesis protein CcmH